MIPEDRRREILALLEERGYLGVEELAAKLYVSLPTVRRDLAALAEEGSVRRVHGGASRVDTASFDWPFDLRHRIHLEEKRAIGRLAASLVEDGDHVFIDCGATCLFMARALDPSLSFTALSNCVPTLQALTSFRGVTAECPGGNFLPAHAGVFGSDAAAYVRRRRARIYFASADGLGSHGGVSLRSRLDMEVKRAMRDQAQTMALLLDSSKSGVDCYYRMFDLDEIDILVTDALPPPDLMEALGQAGTRVLTPAP